MAPELGARLLPDGQLLSLTGRDLTEVSGLLQSMDLQLSPAIKTTEADINSLRLRAATNGRATATDLAATFWADGSPDTDLARVANKLNRLSEFDMVTFAYSQTRPEASIASRPLEKPAKPMVMDAPERPV